MTGRAEGRPGMTGPVLAGLLTPASAEDVLRLAFDEAQDRVVGVRVVATADEAEPSGIVERWSGKYPEVPVTVSVLRAIDPAITLTAATRSCCLAVLPRPADTRATALIGAVARRSGCPVVLV
jgi:hypothetical protein